MIDVLGALLSLTFVVGIFYLFGWRWHIRPLIHAWREREWGWLVAILVFGWLGGLFYVACHADEPLVA